MVIVHHTIVYNIYSADLHPLAVRTPVSTPVTTGFPGVTLGSISEYVGIVYVRLLLPLCEYIYIQIQIYAHIYIYIYIDTFV